MSNRTIVAGYIKDALNEHYLRGDAAVSREALRRTVSQRLPAHILRAPQTQTRATFSTAFGETLRRMDRDGLIRRDGDRLHILGDPLSRPWLEDA